jgi:hypothetical protein
MPWTSSEAINVVVDDLVRFTRDRNGNLEWVGEETSSLSNRVTFGLRMIVDNWPMDGEEPEAAQLVVIPGAGGPPIGTRPAFATFQGGRVVLTVTFTLHGFDEDAKYKIGFTSRSGDGVVFSKGALALSV